MTVTAEVRPAEGPGQGHGDATRARRSAIPTLKKGKVTVKLPAKQKGELLADGLVRRHQRRSREASKTIEVRVK